MMKRLIYRVLLFLSALGCGFGTLSAQTGVGFASVQALSSVPDCKLPLIHLNGTDRLTVSFDDLQDRDMNLRYRVVYLNTDGTPSSLREIEYMEGINKTDISDVEYSFNTRSNYVHYSFVFPQKGRNVKLSGAYRFEIFESENPDRVLLEIPFMVCESGVSIDLKIRPPTRVDLVRSHQEVEVKVKPVRNDLHIVQAERSLQVYAMQNQNTLTLRRLPLSYQTGDDFYYNNKNEDVFDGLNEFRNIDLRPIMYAGRGIDFTRVLNDRWNAQTLLQKSREYKPYQSDDDIDGNFVIKAEGMENSDVEAEYVMVHFVLQENPVPGREVYVIGKFNGWRCEDGNRMTYDNNLKMYTLSLLLKQGFYDYMFAAKTSDGIHIPYLEGNHQETENDYYIYVFYREPGGRNDRLLGVTRGNSRQ